VRRTDLRVNKESPHGVRSLILAEVDISESPLTALPQASRLAHMMDATTLGKISAALDKFEPLVLWRFWVYGGICRAKRMRDPVGCGHERHIPLPADSWRYESVVRQ